MPSTELAEQRADLASSFSSSDLALLDSLLTEDVVWSTSSASPWLGRQLVLDRLAEFFDRHHYTLRFGFSKVDSNADRAVDRVNYESWVDLTPSAGGEPHRGSAVIVWTRDDRWRIAAYIDLGAVLFGPERPSW